LAVWRLADGASVWAQLHGVDRAVTSVAVGALPDGIPVVVSGSYDKAVRVWRLADGAPVGAPLRGHEDRVVSVAVGALPDGTPVIVSGRLAATFSLLICAEEGRAGHERVAWSGRLTHRLLDLGHALP
jgi:WD40 repeat protein